VSSVDFWKTLKGLVYRLSDLAHHLTWSTLNVGIKEVAAVTDAETGEKYQVEWVTMEDDSVCDQCEASAGVYDSDEPFLPTIPAHVMCRCIWMPVEGPYSMVSRP
jgi:hypothetical protein